VLDHLGVNVSDYARSREFYEKALAPLGITLS
jgi:catechol 2,3-dioxygenase-like lactoylglutathione lyase family enzyme